MIERVYIDNFNLVTENGAPAIRLTSAKVESDMFAGLDIRMNFTLEALRNEIKCLPAYITETFGINNNLEKHPDIIMLKDAVKMLESKLAETATTPLQCLLLDQATEAQIAQASHPFANMLLDFLSDKASEPAPQSPQQG